MIGPWNVRSMGGNVMMALGLLLGMSTGGLRWSGLWWCRGIGAECERWWNVICVVRRKEGSRVSDGIFCRFSPAAENKMNKNPGLEVEG